MAKGIGLPSTKQSGKYRSKTTVGSRLRVRAEECRAETKIAGKILNRFLVIDKAQSDRVA